MSVSKYLSRPAVSSALLIAAITLSSGAAFAAESYASSMAGGMSESGASVSNTSSATQQGSNQSSGMSGSLSETQRSTGASGYDSALNGTTPGSAVVKNFGANSSVQNPVMTAQNNQIKTGSNAGLNAGINAGGNNSLIDNAVKQKSSDFAPAAGATSSSPAGRASVQINTNAPVTTTAMPGPKVRVWNGR